jgi:hypothetical protein
VAATPISGPHFTSKKQSLSLASEDVETFTIESTLAPFSFADLTDCRTSAEFNRFLPIRFNENNFWSGLTSSSGKSYTLDNQGLIAKIRNPFNDKSNVIVLAGVRSVGTKSSIIGLTNYADGILRNYKKDLNWALVVQGFDMDSDGKIDNVDILDEVFLPIP